MEDIRGNDINRRVHAAVRGGEPSEVNSALADLRAHVRRYFDNCAMGDEGLIEALVQRVFELIGRQVTDWVADGENVVEAGDLLAATARAPYSDASRRQRTSENVIRLHHHLTRSADVVKRRGEKIENYLLDLVDVCGLELSWIVDRTGNPFPDLDVLEQRVAAARMRA